jgi:hypothetical protein
MYLPIKPKRSRRFGIKTTNMIYEAPHLALARSCECLTPMISGQSLDSENQSHHLFGVCHLVHI